MKEIIIFHFKHWLKVMVTMLITAVVVNVVITGSISFPDWLLETTIVYIVVEVFLTIMDCCKEE